MHRKSTSQARQTTDDRNWSWEWQTKLKNVCKGQKLMPKAEFGGEILAEGISGPGWCRTCNAATGFDDVRREPGDILSCFHYCLHANNIFAISVD